MAKIVYTRRLDSHTVHISLAVRQFADVAIFEATLCGQPMVLGQWKEASRPTGMESDLRRCKKCDRKRIEGVPAFDYEEELAALEERVGECESHGVTGLCPEDGIVYTTEEA